MIPYNPECSVVQDRGTDGHFGAVLRPRPDLHIVVEETRASGSDCHSDEAENRDLRCRPGDLPDGAGTSARSFEEALHPSMDGDDLVGRYRGRGTAALLPVAWDPDQALPNGQRHLPGRRSTRSASRQSRPLTENNSWKCSVTPKNRQNRGY